MTSAATDLTVAAWPGCAPRLLRLSQAGAEDFVEYAQAGGYRPVADADALLGQVDLSGLLGRGGAAFPMGTKLCTVRDAGRRGSDTVIVANGEEGEPASVKDRWLLRNANVCNLRRQAALGVSVPRQFRGRCAASENADLHPVQTVERKGRRRLAQPSQLSARDDGPYRRCGRS